MKTKGVLACVGILAATAAWGDEAAKAEPGGWNLHSDVKLTLAQSAYSDNWVGGEKGSLAWVLNWTTDAERQIHPIVNSKSTSKLSFGQTHLQDEAEGTGEKRWKSPSKSTDLIDLESVVRFTLGKFVDPFAGVRFESQFIDQGDPARPQAVNPMQFTESFGIARVLSKAEDREWTTRLGAGFRQRADRDVPVEDGFKSETTNDGGLTFDSDLTRPLAGGRTKWKNKLTVFQAVFSSAADRTKGTDHEDDWKAIDVNLENSFTVDISRYLLVSLYDQLLYDKEIDRGGRFKQALGAGFTFKLR